MDLSLCRWGNSLALRLPQELLRQLGDVRAGDRIQVEALGPMRIGVALDAQALQQRRSWLESLQQLQQQMPRTEPVARDAWSRY